MANGVGTVLVRVLLAAFLIFVAIKLFIPSDESLNSRRTIKERNGKKTPWAYLTVVCDESDARPAMVLVHSIRSAKAQHEVVVITRNVSSMTKQIFTSLGAEVDPLPQPFTSLGDMPLSSLDNLVNGNLSAVPSCFQAKFSMWTLAQYEKILYLDANMLVLENIDDLFKRSELTAAPDNDLPDRFNPGLMLLEPSQRTFLGLLKEYARLKDILQEEAQDLLFFNHFFIDWPQKGPEYHLDYGYNANSRLGYSATWNEWVHPKLKAIRFSGPFERWDDIMDKHYPPTRRYDHIRWELLRDMYSYLVQQGIMGVQETLLNQECHTDYMNYSRGSSVARKLSVLIRFNGDLTLLPSIVRHYNMLKFVHQIFVLPTSEAANKAVSVGSFWKGNRPDRVILLDPQTFTASESLKPIKNLATDCLIICDERVQVSGAVLQSVFKYWIQNPHRVVGFFPSAHYRDPVTNQLVYVGAPRGEYSMTSLRLLMMHSDYLQSYSCSLPQAVRDYIDRSPECQDIAFNVLAVKVSDATPLLMVDSEKRVVEEAASESLLALQVKGQTTCLNDLEAMLGALPLRNSSEAKVFLEHDVFTKVEFHDPENEGGPGGDGSSGEEPLQFEPIFDYQNQMSGDENLRFMAALPRITAIPEVVVMPSPQQPQRILCIQGFSANALCHAGKACDNSYAISTYRNTPTDAVLMLGTTLIVQSRLGFEDRFHTPNLLANLFYPYPDYGFMKPARMVLYKRGGMDGRLSNWSKDLFSALVGENVLPLKPRFGSRPLCFERSVMTRRYRPVPAERNIVMREAQERAWSYCLTKADKLGATEVEESWGFVSVKKEIARVVFLYGDLETGYGAISNLEELVKELEGFCLRSFKCELLQISERNFTEFCQQILHLGSADIFITPTGDGTMNHVIFMRSQAKVLELVPFGVPTYDGRVLKVYQEAARWMGLEHSALFESTGPECSTDETQACRQEYRERAMEVDVPAVVKWLHDATKSSPGNEAT